MLADEGTELDLDGAVTVLVKGGVRQDGGKTWRVQHATNERVGDQGIPIYCVYLKEDKN